MSENQNINSIKCVVVGDGFVGKTTLLMRLCQKEFDEENYCPTVFDNYSMNVNHDGQNYQIIFFDTAGQEDYSLLRKQVYDSTNIFLICFSITSTDSFSNVKQIWLQETEEYSSAIKILIGTKKDLRNDTETIDKLNANGEIFVSQSMATNLAKSHNMRYIECSSVTQKFGIFRFLQFAMIVSCNTQYGCYCLHCPVQPEPPKKLCMGGCVNDLENVQEIMKTILEVNSLRLQEKKKMFSKSVCCINPILRLIRRVLCCKNNY